MNMASTQLRNVVGDDLIDDILVDIILEFVDDLQGDKPRMQPTARKMGLTEGVARLCNLLECGHNTRIKASLRMEKEIFDALILWFQGNTNLRSSKHVAIEMKVAVFLFITTRHASQRDTFEMYGLGGKQISKYGID